MLCVVGALWYAIENDWYGEGSAWFRQGRAHMIVACLSVLGFCVSWGFDGHKSEL
jgi:hypothetical protein